MKPQEPTSKPIPDETATGAAPGPGTGLPEPPSAVLGVPELMAAAAATFRERNAQYGDSYKTFHRVAMSLFPDGLNLKTEDEWCRFSILFMAVGKLVRYCNQFAEGGHVDSTHDLGVYAFMLEEVTRINQEKKREQERVGGDGTGTGPSTTDQ